MQLNSPSLSQSRNVCAPSTIQVPLHQNIPDNTSLLAIGTDLLPLQLLESRSGRSVGILAQSIDPQEAELVRVVVRVLLVTPMAIESKPIHRVPKFAIRNLQ